MSPSNDDLGLTASRLSGPNDDRQVTHLDSDGPLETSLGEYATALLCHLEFQKGLAPQEFRLLHLVEVDRIGYQAAAAELGMTVEDVRHTMLELRQRRNASISGISTEEHE